MLELLLVRGALAEVERMLELLPVREALAEVELMLELLPVLAVLAAEVEPQPAHQLPQTPAPTVTHTACPLAPPEVKASACLARCRTAPTSTKPPLTSASSDEEVLLTNINC